MEPATSQQTAESSAARRVEDVLCTYRARVEKLIQEQRAKPDMIAHSELRAALTPADRYGHLPGVGVGAAFNNRGELAILGLHTQIMRGIYYKKPGSGPGSGKGALAIVLSGGYADDEDEGQAFWYTGEGGQKHGKQVADQTFTNGNLALRTSHETGSPVRVFRGSKEGGKLQYTYEGLYKVTAVKHVASLDGPLVCKFRMEGVPGESATTSTVGYRSVYSSYGGSRPGRGSEVLAQLKSAPKHKKPRLTDQGSAQPHPPPSSDTTSNTLGTASSAGRVDSACSASRLRRMEQLQGQAGLLCPDISNGAERGMPIPLFNEVDDAALDPGFQYIADYEFSPGLQDKVKAVLKAEAHRMSLYTRSAQTKGCGVTFRLMITDADCKWLQVIKAQPEVFDWAVNTPDMLFLTQSQNYASNGCLLSTEPCGIHECDPHCSRTAGCELNKQVTNGIRSPLEVFRTPDKGWGLRCSKTLASGTFVCCYIGQLVSEAMVQRLSQGGKDRYLLRLELFMNLLKDMFENGLDVVEADAPAHRIPPPPQLPFPRHLMDAGHKEPQAARHPAGPGASTRLSLADFTALLSVDAAQRGNVARFINHSCEANLEIQGVFAKDARSVVLYYIAFFTTQEVPAGTELTFNYATHKDGLQGDRGVACRCGAAACTGRLT